MYDSINHWIAALYVDNCAWHIGDDKWMCTMICICVRSHLQTPLGHPPSYRSCFGHVPLPWSKQSCKTLDRLFPKRLHYQPRVHHHFKLIGDYSLKTQWTRPPTVVWWKNGKNGCLTQQLQLLKQGETGAKILRPRATSNRKPFFKLLAYIDLYTYNIPTIIIVHYRPALKPHVAPMKLYHQCLTHSLVALRKFAIWPVHCHWTVLSSVKGLTQFSSSWFCKARSDPCRTPSTLAPPNGPMNSTSELTKVSCQHSLGQVQVPAPRGTLHQANGMQHVARLSFVTWHERNRASRRSNNLLAASMTIPRPTFQIAACPTSTSNAPSLPVDILFMGLVMSQNDFANLGHVSSIWGLNFGKHPKSKHNDLGLEHFGGYQVKKS